jgi:hypothetical protein
MRYGEIEVKRVLHVVYVDADSAYRLCDVDKANLAGNTLFYTIGTYPHIATYCKECVKLLLERTGK